MKPHAKWKLPDTIDPSETKCASIIIPNDPDHIAAFNGAIYQLTRWYNWQGDEDHTAALVANVWKRAYDTINISDDCTAEPIPWCGLSDFHDNGQPDIWEPSQYDSRGESYYADFDHGYRLDGNYSANGASQLCVIHAHFTEAIHVTRARIGWMCIPGSNVGGSLAFVAPTSNPNDESVYTSTSELAPDWNGFHDTPDVNWTSTDFIVRVQADAASPGSRCDATLIIFGINFYGDGPAPVGMAIC